MLSSLKGPVILCFRPADGAMYSGRRGRVHLGSDDQLCCFTRISTALDQVPEREGRGCRGFHNRLSVFCLTRMHVHMHAGPRLALAANMTTLALLFPSFRTA